MGRRGCDSLTLSVSTSRNVIFPTRSWASATVPGPLPRMTSAELYVFSGAGVVSRS